MTLKRQKFLSGMLACIGALVWAVFFSPPLEVAPDGTVASDGVGRALEVIIVAAIIYGLSFFTLRRASGQAKE